MTIRGMAALAVAFLLFALANPAEAKYHHHHRYIARIDSQVTQNCVFDNSGHQTCRGSIQRTSGHPRASRIRVSDANGNDPRPHAWCGWWMRHQLGVADRAYNLARNWARYGSRADGAAIGTVVVWPHHVGIITGHSATGWIVLSGNDGHAVRERERSLRGAIAFRWPTRMALN